MTMNSRVVMLLVVLISSSFFAKVCASTDAASRHGDDAAEAAVRNDRDLIPLHDDLVHDHMGMFVTIQVGIGDKTLPFFFDTGGGLTLITPELADYLGLEQFGRVTGFRMNGERLDLIRCEEATLRVGPRDIWTELAVFDLMSLLPPGCSEVGGVVSLHTFKEQIITIDLDSAAVWLETGNSLKQRVETMAPLSIRFSRQASGSSIDLFVEVRAKMGSLWVEVDTGNTGPVLLAPHALRQLGLSEEKGAGPWSGVVRLDIIGLGEIEASAAETDLSYDGVLNFETIKQLILTIDLPNEQAWGSIR
jgi:predicted aspartyl protease